MKLPKLKVHGVDCVLVPEFDTHKLAGCDGCVGRGRREDEPPSLPGFGWCDDIVLGENQCSKMEVIVIRAEDFANYIACKLEE